MYRIRVQEYKVWQETFSNGRSLKYVGGGGELIYKGSALVSDKTFIKWQFLRFCILDFFT